MRIVSWNINSVRLRMPLVEKVVKALSPDILCLQETKVDDPLFPHDAIKECGFTHTYCMGQKSYNGVAILAKTALTLLPCMDILPGHQRHIAAVLPDGTQLHNFYVPAGGDIPDRTLNEKFGQKLDFIDAMTAWSGKQKPAQKMIILGDFNIAPLEHDVWSHKQMLKIVSHTPVEVEKLTALQNSLGWIDAHRHFVPHDEKLYSWWSYRAQDWEGSNRGRRLDHIWVTPNLKTQLQSASIFKPARGWEQPSDHVPIIMDIAL